MPQRPTSPADALSFITATLAPAVDTIQSGAQVAQADYEREAREASDAKTAAEAAKAAAQQAIARHAEEQAQAEAQQKTAANKAQQAARVKKELQVTQTLYGLIPDLPEARQPALQQIADEQLDGLMADLGMSFDPAAPAPAPAGSPATPVPPTDPAVAPA